jgi:hypothetical protein
VTAPHAPIVQGGLMVGDGQPGAQPPYGASTHATREKLPRGPIDY